MLVMVIFLPKEFPLSTHRQSEDCITRKEQIHRGFLPLSKEKLDMHHGKLKHSNRMCQQDFWSHDLVEIRFLPPVPRS